MGVRKKHQCPECRGSGWVSCGSHPCSGCEKCPRCDGCTEAVLSSLELTKAREGLKRQMSWELHRFEQTIEGLQNQLDDLRE